MSAADVSVSVEGGAVFLSTSYDEGIVSLIRALPTRRWRPETRDWVVPARRDDLRAVLCLVGQLEERGVAVSFDRAAKGRVKAHGLTRVIVRDRVIELIFPYDPERLTVWRGLPDRRYNDTRKSWERPLTRVARSPSWTS